jgi:hypothetical protein
MVKKNRNRFPIAVLLTTVFARGQRSAKSRYTWRFHWLPCGNIDFSQVLNVQTMCSSIDDDGKILEWCAGAAINTVENVHGLYQQCGVPIAVLLPLPNWCTR